ncbi:MAG: hypothetical protein Q9226_008228 [Calogaya cf. arnoldii]
MKQEEPSEELRVVSQPPGFESVERFRNYVYRADRQREIFIYHTETGINQDHEHFRDRQIEWLYSAWARKTGNNVRSEKTQGHSTCTASKAMGNTYGTVKFATLVVVKMPDFTAGSYGETFGAIADDIREKGRQYKSIVTVFWTTKKPVQEETFEHYEDMEAAIIEVTSELHVPIVFAAGNDALYLDKKYDRPRLRTDKFPTNHVDKDTHTG